MVCSHSEAALMQTAATLQYCLSSNFNDVDVLYIYKHNPAQLLLPTSCRLSIWPPEGPLHHLKSPTVKQSCAEPGLLQAICGKAMMCYILPAHYWGNILLLVQFLFLSLSLSFSLPLAFKQARP